MKLPLGITLALFLILQTFQQASTQIPEDWERNNGTIGDKGKQPHSEEITAKPTGESKEDIQSNVDAQANPESGTESKEQPFGTFYYSEGGQQNSTKLDQMPEQSIADTEEASSEGPIATTTPPPMIARNSSSELSDTSAESNETLTQDTATNTSTPEPEHTNESTLYDTYTSPQPETTTTESSHDESGSGYLPSDDVPTNSTTKSPTTTTKDESVQNKTTVSPTEPPVHRTTTAVISPTVSEDVTTPAPDSEDTNQTEPVDTRGNSERGLSSDVTKSKKGQAWTVVLVIAIIVGVLAMGAFIILNRRNKKDFSHRKLVEEMSPDPVLRLDNSEPLDLKFDGFGYYNPGLQGDNIQMSNFPQGHSK